MEELCAQHGCEILYAPPFEGTADKLLVDFSPNFNRKIIADLEPLIEKNWLQLKKELGDKLYNDDKFRIHSVKETEDNIAVVEVGITDYKSYVGTNLGNDLNVFVARGMTDFSNKKACVSDALGVGSIVLTADNYLLLVRRSFEVAEGQGMTDFPGGHAEPKALYSLLFSYTSVPNNRPRPIFYFSNFFQPPVTVPTLPFITCWIENLKSVYQRIVSLQHAKNRNRVQKYKEECKV